MQTLSLPAEPDALLAARLIERIANGRTDFLVVARSEPRGPRLHQAVVAGSRPNWRRVLLPAWDCLPYDRVTPALQIMGLADGGARIARRPRSAGSCC